MSCRLAVLLILDGYGLAPPAYGNAVSAAQTPYLDSLFAKWPHARISASGLDVGLPAGQFGNSEVGHTNLGAGRVVYQDLARITREIEQGDFFENPVLKEAVSRCAGEGAPALHLMGLLSDGGVHSHMEHLYALVELARRCGVRRLYVHAFTDGRDVAPESAVTYIGALQGKLWEMGVGELATVCGRYYAMDRDNRWERVKQAYDCLTERKGQPARDILAGVRACYEAGVTDEFLPPMVVSQEGEISAGDSVIFFNFRPDRARELTRALLDPDFSGFERPEGPMELHYVCMTQYDAAFESFPQKPAVAYPPHDLKMVLGELLSREGLRQLRIAETEKYAHVTFFLNGGREDKFEGEERILVASPKVATYDLQPEMSAPEVADKLVAALNEQKFDFICLNFANGDMVGHTGVYEAIVKAVKAVDGCVEKVVEAAKANGYEVVMIADHGNADNAINPDGTPNTAHSLNPVPIVVVSDRVKAVHSGILADVAPTVLKLMGLPQPEEMTGKALVEMK